MTGTMTGTRPTKRATHTLLCALSGALLAASLAGCEARDRAGGEADADVTVLTFAQPNDGEPPDQLVVWADAVRAASGGSLEIAFDNGWRLGEPTYESATVADIRDGEIDMGWVGARALDRAGITSFQALLAPMLVDSQALQAAVFEEGIPQEMLAEIEDQGEGGVVGVGVLPGPLRKVLGVDHPFVQPSDFRGAVVGMQDSVVAESTFRALGGTAEAMPSGADDLSRVDAYEQQLQSIWGNQYQFAAGYLTADLNLWPRTLVLLISEDVYGGLTEDQQRALRDAGEEAVLPALDASAAEDADNADKVCSSGLQIDALTSAQRTELQQACGPGVRRARTDEQSADWLDRIADLKAGLGAPADGLDCSGSGEAAVGALPNGTYRTTLTVADVAEGCPAGAPGADPLLDREQVDRTLEFTVTGDEVVQTEYPVGQPELREPGWQGTYRTFRDTFELAENGSVEPLSMRWDFDGRQLVLSQMRTESCDHKTIWTSNPWTIHRPQAGEVKIDGTWTTRLTAADWHSGDGPAGTFTMTIGNGRLSLSGPDGDVGFYGDVALFRDRLSVTGGPDDLHADVAIEDDQLVFTGVTVAGSRTPGRTGWCGVTSVAPRIGLEGPGLRVCPEAGTPVRCHHGHVVTVLIVDDHAGFRSFARDLLTAGGLEVVGEAGDGDEAVREAARLGPDIVLLDVVLPGMDGFGVCERLAAGQPRPAVVLTSSRGAREYGDRLTASSARGFLTKEALSVDALLELARRR